MGLLDVINDLATNGVYTVTRHAAGSLSAGRWTPGNTSTLSVVMVVQPLRGRELQVVPEGMRATDVRMLYSATELRPTPGGPDVVTIDGEGYAVYLAEKWELRGQIFWRCFASRVAVP